MDRHDDLAVALTPLDRIGRGHDSCQSAMPADLYGVRAVAFSPEPNETFRIEGELKAPELGGLLRVAHFRRRLRRSGMKHELALIDVRPNDRIRIQPIAIGGKSGPSDIVDSVRDAETPRLHEAMNLNDPHSRELAIAEAMDELVEHEDMERAPCGRARSGTRRTKEWPPTPRRSWTSGRRSACVRARCARSVRRGRLHRAAPGRAGAHPPAPRPRRAVPRRQTAFLVLHDPSGAVLLERRPPSGIWGRPVVLPGVRPRRRHRGHLPGAHRGR